MKTALCFLRISVSRFLRGRSGNSSRISSGEDLPDALDDVGQEGEGPVLGIHHPLPVPLVHVAAVVVVEEVVLPDGAHVGEDALAHLAVEHLERGSFPLRGGLHDLRVDRVLVVVVVDVELDRGARAVAIERVVHAAAHVADEGRLDAEEVQRLAQAVLDEAPGFPDRELSLLHVLGRFVVRRENLLQILVVADSRTGKVRLLVVFCHSMISFT
jgi:hypothetical protein